MRKDRRLVPGEDTAAEARPAAWGPGRVDERGAATGRAAHRHLARDAEGAPCSARRHRPRSNGLSHVMPVKTDAGQMQARTENREI